MVILNSAVTYVFNIIGSCNKGWDKNKSAGEEFLACFLG